MAVRQFYNSVLSHFPSSGMRLAFAYGSGVFQQVGHDHMDKNMVDFIFAVDNAKSWHEENLSRNRSHYSFLKHLGGEKIASIQTHYGAGIYFNTLVKCENRYIKYGVISTNALISDLLHWDTLYVSGRLHKPVLFVIDNFSGDEDKLKLAIKENQFSAVHTALLLLPDQFTEDEYYQTIAGLSYNGDIRMGVGEDKNKVENIVVPNIERFRDLYKDITQQDEFVEWEDGNSIIKQSLCNMSRSYHLSQLPFQVLRRFTEIRNLDGRHRDVEEVIRAASHNMEYEELLKLSMADIVKHSSRSQSLKGIFTAGFKKSVLYSFKKVKKMWKSKKK